LSRTAGRAAPTRQPNRDADIPATPSRFEARWLAARLRSLVGAPRGRRLCVAFSGGIDSTALLAALATLRVRLGFRLRALHVDHGLYPESEQWAAAAAALARRLRVPCEVLRIRVRRARGESLEAAARDARYQALGSQLEPGELLLTAHQQDDQLETLLLALMRGSGVRGLAGIGERGTVGGVGLLRPLLPIARAQLEHYVRARGLICSEDRSNADERFDRNYLRRQVLPRLRARWPAAAALASRSASHLAEAQSLLDQMARHASALAADGSDLRVSVLRRLSMPERRNLLRSWISMQGLPLPDHRRLREMAGPLLAARADASPRIAWRGGELRRHGDRLTAMVSPSASVARETGLWNWRKERWWPLGRAARIGLVPDRHGDVDLESLPCPLRVGFRRGGERLRESHGRLALKDLLQARGIEPWRRGAVPLLCAGRRIVAVADLWLDAKYRAAGHARERGRLRWRLSD